jgi:phage virion morphogenesis protein
MTIRINTAQLKALHKKVKKASEEDLFPLLDAIGDQQANSARRRIIETKKDPSGAPWKPWSPNYARTRHGGNTLLRDTGALVDSMTHQVDAPGKAVNVGSNLVYAATHQYGDPTRKIPARPFLDDSFSDPFDQAEVKDIVSMWLEGLL